MSDQIKIRGASEHNLKNIDLDIPRDSLVVFTGLSGSGKSSLAFDTIFAEGQRRYVESLSAYARQFLGQMDKPAVESIDGLSPAVSIDQKSTNRNPRSTVGTITEIYDYLRLLFARAGIPHCAVCGAVITKQSPQQIVDQILLLPERTKFQILAPVVKGRKGEHVELFQSLQQAGFARVLIDDQEYELSAVPKLKKQEKHTVEVIVDRLTVTDKSKQRMTDSIETALNLAAGVVIIDFVEQPKDSPERKRRFSEKLACPNEHPITIDSLEPVIFSFNSPFGACPSCDGLGFRQEVDEELLITDPELSLKGGAISLWTGRYFSKILEALAKELDFSLHTKWKNLPEDIRNIVMNGGNDIVLPVRFRGPQGTKVYNIPFEGVVANLQKRIQNTDSEQVKVKITEYLRQVPCKSCHGARLKPDVLAVKLPLVGGEINIAELCNLSLREALELLSKLDLTQKQQFIADSIIKEIKGRLNFLLDVGLHYLSLDRQAGTLSGGEAQRIRLATQIGAGLAGVLYVLDEPSIGLHQRDNLRLIATLEKLRDLGNTLIVVEHDEDTIRMADWIVDIGPLAGEFGGEVVHNGTYQELLKNADSITGQYLSGKRKIIDKLTRRKLDMQKVLRVFGAKENNLQNITVDFPLGGLVVVTGVSGSGKSTLVNDILATSLAVKLNGSKHVPGKHTNITGVDYLDKLVQIDQSPIGRTPRSNPATYTGVFDKIRALFAATPEAKVRGYQPGRFSFNVKGGRCENCEGAGTIKIEMNFLPDVYVPCEVCQGARYNRETLEVKYKGKNIAEVLNMPITEANEFFATIPAIHRYLNTLVEVGLGYIRLGQAATTLSGGEAQRVKLAAELQKKSTGKTIYILDEPTTGLHFEDIKKLLLVINGLVDKGNSVIIIEHNLDIIKSADWVIDLGPDGGSGGGKVVASGTPEQVAKNKTSYTGAFLKQLL